MAGLEFEAFLACLLAKMGYTDLEITKINDMGGDIVCRSPTQEKVVVQAKRWRGSVGVQAVQEVLGAALYYDCDVCLVITNSRFTRQAEELAAKSRAGHGAKVTLHGGLWLAARIDEHALAQIPPFNWERFRKEVAPAVRWRRN